MSTLLTALAVVDVPVGSSDLVGVSRALLAVLFPRLQLGYFVWMWNIATCQKNCLFHFIGKVVHHRSAFMGTWNGVTTLGYLTLIAVSF